MNEILNSYLTTGVKLMPEMHLRRPGFTYSAGRIFMKNKERIQKIKETGDSQYIYQNELDRACFQHDMAYGDFKDWTRVIASDKILHDKAFDMAKNPKYDVYQRGLASMVYKLFDKTTSATYAWLDTLATRAMQATRNKFAGSGIKNENISSKELAEELRKQLLKNLRKEKYTHHL